MPEIAKWDNFYVIVGSAAGALIGLQFAHSDCQQTPGGCTGGWRRVRQSDHRSLQRYFAFVCASTCSVANNHSGCIVLGPYWYRRDGLYADRHRTNAKATGIQTTIRGLVVSFRVALHRVRHACDVGIRGFLAHARCVVWRCRRGAARLLLFTGIHNAWDSVAYHVLVNSAGAHRERGHTDPNEE